MKSKFKSFLKKGLDEQSLDNGPEISAKQLFYNHFIHEGLAEKNLGNDRESLIEQLLTLYEYKEVKTSSAEENKLAQYVESRQITNLIHFTHIDNLENIFQFGLIPRSCLEKKGLRTLITSRFPGIQQQAGFRGANRLSISIPDYEMFSNMSKNNTDNWAMILFGVESILKHQCAYDPGEVSKRMTGVHGLRELFADSKKREKLRLDHWITTNPKAEVSDYSRIPNAWIKEVHLSTSKHIKRVKHWGDKYNVQIRVDQKLFEPRIGHYYWPSSEFQPKIDCAHWPPSESNRITVESIYGQHHWEFLLSAIKDSESTLFILSGWISTYVINEHVLSLLKDAIKRGVKIYLGYGFSYPGKSHTLKPEAKKALELLGDLQEQTVGEKGKLCFKEFKNHAKLIIVDNKYRIVGSNNWLSNNIYSNNEYSIKICYKK